MKSTWIGWVLVLATSCTSGCTTLTRGRSGGEVTETVELENMKADAKRLQARVEGLEATLHRISEDTETVRSGSGRSQQDLAARVTALEQAVRALDLAREADKKEILNFLQSLTKGSGASSPVQGGYEHVVQAGETLSKIATAYRVTVESIVKANNLPNAHSIRVGQKLFIPESGGAR